jgi:hypothetical protein
MRSASQSATYRLLITGLLCWGVAGTAYALLRLTFGDRPAFVHVRWSPSVDTAARKRLEQGHHLALPQFKEDRTFGYALTDLSRESIQSLVLDPAAEDTHNIHRTKFRVGYFSPRLPYLTSHPWVPTGLEILTALWFLGGLSSIGLALLDTTAPSLVRGRILSVRHAFLEPRAASRTAAAHTATWVIRRIPHASAEAVAVFRVVFGGLLVNLALTKPVSATMAMRPSNVVSPIHELLLRIFVEAPATADWLPAWILAWGALFIVGAFARTAFACLSVGMLGWATLYTTTTTYHTVCALLLSLLALQGSRWGDAWSVDVWRRTQPSQRATPTEYGYVTWAPGLVLGVVYFAAAFAKMRDTGFAWVLNGTVKYHFLSDSPQAMVDWGLRVGHYPRLAVALSFGAIALEALVIVGVAAGAYRYRLAAGVGALSLMAGFTLLQGLFWPAWWILLLSFLPWHLVRPANIGALPFTDALSADRPASQPRLVIVLVLALFVQQGVVSLLRIEGAPVLSTYDMYSTTYASPADYEHNAGQVYWVVGLDRTAQTHRCRITAVDADRLARDGRDGDRSLMEEFLRRCVDASIPLREAFVETTRVQVDWARWQRLDEPLRTRLTEPVAFD